MYLATKFLHVLSVIAFLGNITTGLFWHAHAARTKDAALLAFTMDGIIRSDRLFTTPAVWHHGKETTVFVADFSGTGSYALRGGRLTHGGDSEPAQQGQRHERRGQPCVHGCSSRLG